MTSTLACSVRRSTRAFTLIELLTVIAIIGILAAIMIPTVGKVRESAKKTKTRVQFTQWAAGVRLFKQTYGYYPRFEPSTAANRHLVNGSVRYNSTSVANDDYLFQELLTGKPAKPSGATFIFASDEADGSTSIQNRKRQQCLSFDIAEITSLNEGDKVGNVVKDAFGNVEIAVLVDRNADGFINLSDLSNGITEFPELTAKDNNGTLSSATVLDKIVPKDATGNRTKGTRADVIFYSPGRGVSSSILEKDAVWSW